MTKRVEKAINLVFKMNKKELEQLIEAVKQQWSNLESMQKFKFQVGDKVSFEHKGKRVKGIVIKILQKNIGIKTDDGRKWRVSPSLLRKTWSVS